MASTPSSPQSLATSDESPPEHRTIASLRSKFESIATHGAHTVAHGAHNVAHGAHSVAHGAHKVAHKAHASLSSSPAPLEPASSSSIAETPLPIPAKKAPVPPKKPPPLAAKPSTASTISSSGSSPTSIPILAPRPIKPPPPLPPTKPPIANKAADPAVVSPPNAEPAVTTRADPLTISPSPSMADLQMTSARLLNVLNATSDVDQERIASVRSLRDRWAAAASLSTAKPSDSRRASIEELLRPSSRHVSPSGGHVSRSVSPSAASVSASGQPGTVAASGQFSEQGYVCTDEPSPSPVPMTARPNGPTAVPRPAPPAVPHASKPKGPSVLGLSNPQSSPINIDDPKPKLSSQVVSDIPTTTELPEASFHPISRLDEDSIGDEKHVSEPNPSAHSLILTSSEQSEPPASPPMMGFKFGRRPSAPKIITRKASADSTASSVKPLPPAPPIPRSTSPAPAGITSQAFVGSPSGSPYATPTISRSASPALGKAPPTPPKDSNTRVLPQSPVTPPKDWPRPLPRESTGHRPPPPPPPAQGPTARTGGQGSATQKPPLPTRKPTIDNFEAMSSLQSGESAPPALVPRKIDAAPVLPVRRQTGFAPTDNPTNSDHLLAESTLPVRSSSVAAPAAPGRFMPRSPIQSDKPLTGAPSTRESHSPPPVALRARVMATKPTTAGNRPPLPGNKPLAPTVAPVGSLPSEYSMPPRLPQRRQTIDQGSAASRPSISVNPMVQENVPPVPPPLRSVGPRTGTDLPPPPLRSAGATAASSGIRRAATVHRNGDHVPRRNSSDDEEDSSTHPRLDSIAQRLLDEHPDATSANRKPPDLVPDFRVHSTHEISSFTVHGRWAVIGHHDIKVYDSSTGNRPAFTFELRETGLNFHSKEARATALGFRPGTNKSQEGRFLWCGSKEGHIWEIDVKLQMLTKSRDSAHSDVVISIMRHQNFVLTLDKRGKLNVWEVTPATNEADMGDDSVKLVRSLRLSDKLTFAKMLKGRLWTATAPAARSTTTNSSAKVSGPTIRVYDPCSSEVAPPQSELTSEWTGAATSATIMPFHQEKVFLGHEGGFVSIWDSETVTCLQVLKVSSTDVISLEGVGHRLWAGNRRGQIHVYEVDTLPWITTNIWTAHEDQPVKSLMVDPYSIELGSFALWSLSRNGLAAWDGLLRVDWVDKAMIERQPDYCDFRAVNVLVCSWNIDSCKPRDLETASNRHFLHDVLTSVDSPDIIVFGFQEVVPLTDKKLTAKTLLFGKSGKDSKTTSDRVSGAYGAWVDALRLAIHQVMPADTPYVKVYSDQLVGLFTCMFVKKSEQPNLRDVDITAVKRGIGNVYGNKGAIVARMVLDDTSICFINVHLAAGQRHKQSRNADLAAILEDKAVFKRGDDTMPYIHGGDGEAILDHEFVVLNGDLNYRIDQRREAVENAIRERNFAYLLQHDQLKKEMLHNHAFRLRRFEEAPITFAPTYKYDQGTDNYDTSDKMRIPAWCDRVLYIRSPHIAPLSYQRYEVNCSDHRPVSAGLSIATKRINQEAYYAVRKRVYADLAKVEGEMLTSIAQAYKSCY